MNDSENKNSSEIRAVCAVTLADSGDPFHRSLASVSDRADSASLGGFCARLAPLQSPGFPSLLLPLESLPQIRSLLLQLLKVLAFLFLLLVHQRFHETLRQRRVIDDVRQHQLPSLALLDPPSSHVNESTEPRSTDGSKPKLTCRISYAECSWMFSIVIGPIFPPSGVAELIVGRRQRTDMRLTRSL